MVYGRQLEVALSCSKFLCRLFEMALRELAGLLVLNGRKNAKRAVSSGGDDDIARSRAVACIEQSNAVNEDDHTHTYTFIVDGAP